MRTRRLATRSRATATARRPVPVRERASCCRSRGAPRTSRLPEACRPLRARAASSPDGTAAPPSDRLRNGESVANTTLDARDWSSLCSLQDLVNGADQPIEFLPFGCELPAARRRERVKARAAVVLRGAPLPLHPSIEEQPLERRVQRALADLQHLVRRGPDVLGDAVAVHRTPDEGLEDQQIECARQQVGRLVSHLSPIDRRWEYRRGSVAQSR